jgi:hypothetical protein
LGFGGKWNLWVMFDPNYKSKSGLTETDPVFLEFGSAGGVKYLFEE